ncbi:M20/M25/M40 family metallo-hydrolase [candidate division KSB1 bacterium]
MKKSKQTVIIMVIAILMILSQSLFAQKSPIRVDGNVIKSYIEYMASDDKLGRKTLTPGYEMMADWAAEKFKEWGLEPAGENGTYFQSVPIAGTRGSFAWNMGIPEMRVGNRDFYIKENDFAIDYRSTPGRRVSGEVVFAGYGISSPYKGLDEYSGIDVRGKIVLVLKGSPSEFSPPTARFSPATEVDESRLEDWTEETTDMAKIMTAYDKGASAVILYDPPDPARSGGGSDRRQREPVQESPFTRPFIVISSISEPVFNAIMITDYQESIRGFGNRFNNIRKDIMMKTSRSMNTGVTVSLKGYDSTELYGEEFGNNVSRNIIAKIEGTDRGLRDEYVILGGHYDHLGVTNGIVMNGADDNASGSAVTMEVARLLFQNNFRPRRTIIFCLWCGEELGLIGSRYYARNPVDGVTMDKVVTYFNMDMVGLGDKIGAPGALNFPTIYDVILKHQDPDIVAALDASTGGPGGSDHSGFIELGIEALALMTREGYGHPDYHDAGDDTEVIEPEILRKTGQFVLQGVVNLANERDVNLLIEDRQHLYDGLMMNVTNINTNLDIRGGWTVLDARTQNELIALADERAQEMRQSMAQGSPQMQMRGGRGGQRSTAQIGIADAKVFEGNIGTMNLTRTLLNYGRIDFVGDDGYWLSNGVTPEGRRAIGAMEENNVVINLVNPSITTVRSMLNTAMRPILITGSVNYDDMLIRSINDKGAVITVDFNPMNVNRCVEDLVAAKARFGDTDNLVLYLRSDTNLDDAKRELYMELINRGWTRDEILGVAGNNLTNLGR